MTDESSVPLLEFTPEGLVIPTQAAILAGVLADYNAAFGGNLNTALETPQGQLATSTAAIIADMYALFAEYVNQIDPDTASGFMQDAIARIYFLDRSPGAPTVVDCLCTGLFGVVIPVGALAQDTSGNLYRCVEGGTIGVGGNVTLTFANVENGPIPAPEDTVTKIYQAIPGWDTINNPTSGVLGRLVETRAEFEFRRQNSVAINARGSLQAVYANVFDLPGVLDVYAYENVTSEPIEVGSTDYELVPHSLYVAVVGGDNDEIAQAIWEKKDIGCDYNGDTEVTVVDDSGYLPPLPEYVVKFERPESLPIFFAVEIADDASVPADIENLVRAAIVAAFFGADGSQRVRIGSLILASKFYSAVQAIGEISILSILIGTSDPALLTNILAGIDQAPTVDAADITVTLI